MSSSRQRALVELEDVLAGAPWVQGHTYPVLGTKGDPRQRLLLSLLQDRIEQILPPEPRWLHGDPEQAIVTVLTLQYKRMAESGLYQVVKELLPRESHHRSVAGAIPTLRSVGGTSSWDHMKSFVAR